MGQLFARRAAESVVPSEGGDCEGGVSGESGGDSDGVTSLWGEVEPLLVKGIKENIERDIFTSAMDNPELVQKLRKSSSSGSFGSSRSSVSEEEEEEEGGGRRREGVLCVCVCVCVCLCVCDFPSSLFWLVLGTWCI